MEQLEPVIARKNTLPLTKSLAFRLSAMLDAELLSYRDYMPWADAIIDRLDHPPAWILDLAVTKLRSEAVRHTRHFAFCEPCDTRLSAMNCVDEFVASMYLHYERRGISWATLLARAGRDAEARGGRRDCEYFYARLNELEENDYSEEVERKQRDGVIADYGELIAAVREVYQAITIFRARASESASD